MAASISIVGLVASQILLLLCTAATAAATIPGSLAVVNGAAPPPAAATTASDEHPKLPFPFAGGGQPHHLPFPFSGGGRDPAECLEAVHQAESCVVDVLRSLVSPAPAGGARAGAALQGVSDRCFRRGGSLPLLPVHPFRALYAALVRHACGGGGSRPGPRARRPPRVTYVPARSLRMLRGHTVE